MKTFISNLQQIMVSRGLDLQSLSAMSGLSQDLFAQYVSGTMWPKPSELLKLANALNCSVDSLLYILPQVPSGFTCRLLALDVDGVMTDGGMYVTSDQKEIKKFNTRDGMALKMAGRNGVELGFISNGLMQDLIAYRGEMIHVKRIYVGNDKKLPVLEQWCRELGIALSEVAYIGDDLNDIDVLKAVGLSACPADAASAVKAVCNMVLRTPGGQGCVRELADLIGWTA